MGSKHVTQCSDTSSHLKYHLVSRRVKSFLDMSSHNTSDQGVLVHIQPENVTSNGFKACHDEWCRVVSCRVVSSRALSCQVDVKPHHVGSRHSHPWLAAWRHVGPSQLYSSHVEIEYVA